MEKNSGRNKFPHPKRVKKKAKKKNLLKFQEGKEVRIIQNLLTEIKGMDGNPRKLIGNGPDRGNNKTRKPRKEPGPPKSKKGKNGKNWKLGSWKIKGKNGNQGKKAK